MKIKRALTEIKYVNMLFGKSIRYKSPYSDYQKSLTLNPKPKPLIEIEYVDMLFGKSIRYKSPYSDYQKSLSLNPKP